MKFMKYICIRLMDRLFQTNYWIIKLIFKLISCINPNFKDILMLTLLDKIKFSNQLQTLDGF